MLRVVAGVVSQCNRSSVTSPCAVVIHNARCTDRIPFRSARRCDAVASAVGSVPMIRCILSEASQVGRLPSRQAQPIFRAPGMTQKVTCQLTWHVTFWHLSERQRSDRRAEIKGYLLCARKAAFSEAARYVPVRRHICARVNRYGPDMFR